ncbi:MAG: hypothetical protein WBA97_03410 [Actinophytocola sp.]
MNTSVDVVRRLLVRDVPGAPKIGFTLVDVRDVAVAHRLAMESPIAPGNRYILAGDRLWMREIVVVLAEEFNPCGYRVPTGSMPTWLLRLVAIADPSVRQALDFLGAWSWSPPTRLVANWIGPCARPATPFSAPRTASSKCAWRRTRRKEGGAGH